VLVGQRRAASGLYFGGHGRCHRAIGPDAFDGAPEVVDDDGGTTVREEQRVGATDAAARTRDDGDASFKSVHIHVSVDRPPLVPVVPAV
jgi:hypothetical protein